MKRIKPFLETNQVEFYNSLPREQTNFTELQRLSILRIKTLRINENTSIEEHIKDIVNKEEDILSHFYTRMLCAQSLWSTKWFVTQETLLFKRRLKNLEEKELETFRIGKTDYRREL
ncbi:DNA polymerase alpha primase large subunit, partial [Tubulinosema ratisbonensis]